MKLLKYHNTGGFNGKYVMNHAELTEFNDMLVENASNSNRKINLKAVEVGVNRYKLYLI